MTKTEIIEKISGRAGVPESEQKLFFELLLKRCAADLYEDGELTIPDLGRMEYRKTFNENESDYLVFITDEDAELHFDIPQKEETDFVESVDSHFSISIGKSVIPFKDSVENKLFVTESGDEIKRILELKIEKFIGELSESEIGTEGTDIPEEINFPFLKTYKDSDLEDEINKIEQELDESFSEEETKSDPESETVQEDFVEEEPGKVENEEFEELNTADEVTGSDIEEELIEETPEISELTGLTDDWVEESINIPETEQEEIPEAINERVEVLFAEGKEKEVSGNDPAIADAFKYAEEKMARLQNYGKNSYLGIIFTVTIILATAWLVYLSFFTGAKEKPPVMVKMDKSKEFNVVVERSYDIPVSYPYSAGMSGGIYNAIDEDILKPSSGITDETVPLKSDAEISKVPEIRSPAAATRIKGYIYQYNNNGTYAVQVSSWRTKSIAVSETQKYLNAGYNAFIEQTRLEGEDYYRVRVGGFKSLSEAEQFLK